MLWHLCPRLEINIKKRQKMSIPNIAKRTLSTLFNLDMRLKSLMLQEMITDDDIKFILETAHLSPSSFGFEPWHFIVVQDPITVEKTSSRTPLKLDTAIILY
jgi:non-ribosomal peptide synthetase component F